MLTKEPHKRLSVAKVLAHSWTVPPPTGLHTHQVNRQSPLLSGAGDAKNLSQFASAPGGLTVAMREAVETARQAAGNAERSGSEARTAESTTSPGAGGGEGGAEVSSGVSSSPAQGGVARKGRSSSIDKGKPAWGSKFSWLFGRQSSVPVEAHEKKGLGSSAPGQNRMLHSQPFVTTRRSSVPAEAHDTKALASWAVCQNRILHSQPFLTAHGHDTAWSAELPYAGGGDDGDASVLVEGGGFGVGEPARRHSMRSIAYSSEDDEVNGGHQHRSSGSSLDRGTLTGLGGGAAVFASTTSTPGDLKNLAASRRNLLSRTYFNSASRVHRTTASQVGPSLSSPLMEVRATSLSAEPAKDGVDFVALGGSGHGEGLGFGRSSSLMGLGGGENAETLRGRLTQSNAILERSLSSSFAATAATEAMPDVSRGGVSLTGSDRAFDICPVKIATATAAGVADGKDSQQAARGLKAGQTIMQSPSTGTTMTMSPMHEGPESSEACDQRSSVRSSSEHSSTSTSPSTSTAAVENEDVLPGEAPSSPRSLHLPKSPSAKESPKEESSTDDSPTDAMEPPVVLPCSSGTVKIPEGVVGAEVAHVAGVADSGAGPCPNAVAAAPVDALADDAPFLEWSEVAKSRSPRESPPTRLDSLRKEQALPQGREESSGRTVRPGQRGWSSLRESSPPRRPSRQHQRAAQRTLSPYGRPSPGRRSLPGRGVSPGGGLSKAWSTSPAPRASPKWSLSPARSASSASSQREGQSALARWPSPSPAPKGRGGVVAAAETTAQKPSSSSPQRAAPSGSEHGSMLSGLSQPSCQSPRGLVAHPPHDGEENHGEDPSTRQHQERGRTLERLPRSTLERRSTSRSQRDGSPPPRSTASLSPSTQARKSGSKPVTDADSVGTAGTPELKKPVASAIPTSGAATPKPSRSLREAAAAADIWGGAAAPVMRSTSFAFDADNARRHFSYAGARRSGSYASMRRADGVGRTSSVNAHGKDPNDQSSRVMPWSRSRGKGNRLPELGLPSSMFHATGDGGGGGRGVSRGAVVATSGKQDGGNVAADTNKGRKRGKAFGRAVARIFGRRDGISSARPKAGGRVLVL